MRPTRLASTRLRSGIDSEGAPSDYAGGSEQLGVRGEPRLLRGGEWELKRGPAIRDARPVGAVAPPKLEAPLRRPVGA